MCALEKEEGKTDDSSIRLCLRPVRANHLFRLVNFDAGGGLELNNGGRCSDFHSGYRKGKEKGTLPRPFDDLEVFQSRDDLVLHPVVKTLPTSEAGTDFLIKKKREKRKTDVNSMPTEYSIPSLMLTVKKREKGGGSA